MPSELIKLLIFFGVMFVLYCLWIKIKAHFTGRTFSQQTQHDAERQREVVCRNCKFRIGTDYCELHEAEIVQNENYCKYFENRN